MSSRPVQRSSWLLLFVAVTFAGCLPTVGWLPDSSGFVYVSSASDLIHYDLASKKSKTLAHDCGYFAAMNPVDKQIAVAVVKLDKKAASELTLKLFDLEGKALKTLRQPAWGRTGTDDDAQLRVHAKLYWTDDGQTLLVVADGTTGIYDVKSGEMKKTLKGTVAIAFDGTPIRPDGQGFLTVSAPEIKPKQMNFIRWDGTTQKVDIQGELERLKEAEAKHHAPIKLLEPDKKPAPDGKPAPEKQPQPDKKVHANPPSPPVMQVQLKQTQPNKQPARQPVPAKPPLPAAPMPKAPPAASPKAPEKPPTPEEEAGKVIDTLNILGLFWTYWDGDVAVLRADQTVLRFDTRTGICTVEKDGKGVPAGQRYIQKQLTFANGSQLSTWTKNGGDASDVVVKFKSATGEEKTLAENFAIAALIPAPNKQIAVARSMDPQQPILIIDQEGRVVAKLKDGK